MKDKNESCVELNIYVECDKCSKSEPIVSCPDDKHDDNYKDEGEDNGNNEDEGNKGNDNENEMKSYNESDSENDSNGNN